MASQRRIVKGSRPVSERMWQKTWIRLGSLSPWLGEPASTGGLRRIFLATLRNIGSIWNTRMQKDDKGKERIRIELVVDTRV